MSLFQSILLKMYPNSLKHAAQRFYSSKNIRNIAILSHIDAGILVYGLKIIVDIVNENFRKM